MDQSRYHSRARELINSVKGQALSIEERREMAIELAQLMLKEARRVETTHERDLQRKLNHMVHDPKGMALTVNVTDQCFRSQNTTRVADQFIYLINKYGIPRYLNYFKQLQIAGAKWLGSYVPAVIIPLLKRRIRSETAPMILPGEYRKLHRHIMRRRSEGVRINLNHLGEAILGEEEADRRHRIYLEDLANPEIECISVKVSTLGSQLNLLAWDETLEVLEKRLKELYRTAKQHTFKRPNGKIVPKFVYLDMEEYRDLHLTSDLFRRVLDDPEFFEYTAGIVLQSYVPDSYLMQQELTVWAMRRIANGGAPIRIRLVKGANLSMEKVDASLHGWPQATYTTKADVDANYKRMLHYGATPDHAKAARLGVGSHNLFDIAYALLLRSEMGLEKEIGFEMLEGMVDHMRRVVQELSGDMLLYCPVARNKEFVNAVAYLIRRFDENTGPENFLRDLFEMIPGTAEWQDQANHFSLSCHAANAVSMSPSRNQNRFHEAEMPPRDSPFKNEPDTDWSLSQNRKWAETLIREWSEKEHPSIPLVIGGKEYPPGEHVAIGYDPSCPGRGFYHHALAESDHLDKALKAAQKAQKKWEASDRSGFLANIAQELREKRGELIGAMIADTGKTVEEADVEVSEAIDFAEYYRRNLAELEAMDDVSWKPKGVVLVTPPWNFPCSIPLGGIAAALAAGNCVLFKPAPEAVLVGWHLATLCWEAGIPKDVLQFIPCEDEPVGSELIQDNRVGAVILTGSTATAKKMLKLRPGLHLLAETGGKNSMIISELSDRDLAVKDLIQSAFGHSGQKCSACSLAICLPEVYDDPQFRQTLKDAAASLKIGSAWKLVTRINPLIKEPEEPLLQGLTKLEKGESWLLEPQQDPDHPNLWGPGIKLGVKEGSFTHQTELFGPVLALMRADTLDHAIKLANGTPYGLTSGIHTLDQREQRVWMKKIQAGNLYINRGITGAIVRRQPFGGCKESAFGPGVKAGGPNYVMQLLDVEQVGLPTETESPSGPLSLLSLQVEKHNETDHDLWKASIGSYLHHWKQTFSKDHDPSEVLGQKNILRYAAQPHTLLRVQPEDTFIDIMRVIAATLVCKAPLEVSGTKEDLEKIGHAEWANLTSSVKIKVESETDLIERIERGGIRRVRLLSAPSEALQNALANAACSVLKDPVLANGRVELVRYLREIALSINTHRYGHIH